MLEAVYALVLDLVFPSRCLGCAASIGSAMRWCSTCATSLVPADEHACPRCGLVWLDPPPGGGRHLCGGCARRPPPYRRARGVYVYGAALQDALSIWKNRPDEALGRGLGALFAERAAAHVTDGDLVVVPIPSTPQALARRGFNPAGALARPLARRLRCAFAPTALGFTRRPPSSRGLGRSGRATRMRRVFRARPQLVAGRDVVLVDDVMTTGATVSEASRACLAAGAASVEVLVLARVPS